MKLGSYIYKNKSKAWRVRKRNTYIGGKERSMEFLRNTGILLNPSESAFKEQLRTCFFWLLFKKATTKQTRTMRFCLRCKHIFPYTALLTGLLPPLIWLDIRLNNPELGAALVMITDCKQARKSSSVGVWSFVCLFVLSCSEWNMQF